MKRIWIIICLVCCGLPACEDDVQSTIPLAPVDLTLDLINADYELNAALATATFARNKDERLASDRLGYGGILVVNGFGSNAVNLYAYDLACPVEAQPTIRIIPDNEGFASCPKCGAKYSIGSGYGNAVAGSKYNLRHYSVYSTGNGKYRVRQ